jgi:hypothetical protein
MVRYSCHAAGARAKLTGVSLTSELENPGSRFSVFMDQELPGIGSFVAKIAPELPATLARTERGHNQEGSAKVAAAGQVRLGASEGTLRPRFDLALTPLLSPVTANRAVR